MEGLLSRFGSITKRVICRVLVTLAVIVLCGCAAQTIKVVDANGNPVAGALVISEQHPYFFQSWKLGVQITDDQGEAEVVNNRGYIFKDGYFPVIQASELGDDILWTPYSYFAQVTPIYPIINDPSHTEVSVTEYTTEGPIESGEFVVPIGVCASKTVTYNVENSHLKVSSSTQDLTLSERFYFVGAAAQKHVSQLERENNLAFYCYEDGDFYKVGISVSLKLWNSGVSAHKLTIFAAKVSSFEDYIQPDVMCVDSENVSISTFRRYREENPDLYLSPDVRGKLRAMKNQIPCSNEYSEQIFNYVEQFL